jgi:hypothetical protein
MLPNFLVVGAQKAGTTSLHHYLQAHPDIYLPAKKETKFFIHDRYYSKGIAFYEDTYFSEWGGEAAVGEVDPDYMYFEQALPRIGRHLDLTALKLIFIFRNPVDRAFSQYLMNYRRGHETLTFDQAIATESLRIQKGHMENLRYSYATRGYYLRQVERFLEHVDRSRILFLLSHDLEANPTRCIREVYQFLEVADAFVPPNIGERFHRATAPRSPMLARRLRGHGLERRVFRSLIPSASLRQSLRNGLLQLNQTGRSEMCLDPALGRQLAERFRVENTRLADFLYCDLGCWSVESVADVVCHGRSKREADSPR